VSSKDRAARGGRARPDETANPPAKRVSGAGKADTPAGATPMQAGGFMDTEFTYIDHILVVPERPPLGETLDGRGAAPGSHDLRAGSASPPSLAPRSTASTS